MTVKQAAARIGISASLVYELCRLGALRHSRHGRPGRRGTIRISEDALRDYQSSCEREGEEAGDDGPLRFIR